MKSHILFYSNGLAIWHGLPDIATFVGRGRTIGLIVHERIIFINI